MEMDEHVRGARGCSEERETKDPKRKKKTPLQIEMLERAYAVDPHPPEAVRLELSAKLELTNRQLQMWFCNRRLKDRKVNRDDSDPSPLNSKEEQLSVPKERPTFYEYPEAVLASEIEDDALFRRKARQQFAQEDEQVITQVRHKRIKHESDTEISSKNSGQSKLSDLELRDAAIAILSSWGETFHEDGPILGFEFDPLPPGAFGMPIEAGNYSNVIPTVEPRSVLNVLLQDAIAGPRAVVTDIKPKIKNVPRDKQIVLAREQEVPLKLGTSSKARKIKLLAPENAQHAIRGMPGYHHMEINDAQYVQGASKRRSGVIPLAAREALLPKTLPSPAIKAYVKQDAYGFEGRRKNGDQPCVFPPKNGMASSNESIVSFIKQHEAPVYVKQSKKFLGDVIDFNIQNGYRRGSHDYYSFEDSDTERDMEEEVRQFCIKRASQKEKVKPRADYGYEQYKDHIRRNSEETDESMGLIETD